MAEPLLVAERLSIVFGGLRAVSDFNLNLAHGELVGLIGPNGAGKTTVFNLLSGVYTPTEGQILFAPRTSSKLTRISDKPIHSISRMGLARTFQNIRLFKELSVLDNVLISFHPHVGYSSLEGAFRFPRFFSREAAIREQALELLSIFKIEGKANYPSASLPYGEQRKLEIVRALATNPKLLLLDEPAAGMNPQETHALMELIAFIRQRFDLTILLIEHDMSLVMGICERLLVLDYGKTIAQGLPHEIRKDPVVIKAYLGEDAVHA